MHKFSLPLTDPVLIYMVILSIILIVPTLLRKTNIPSIVGLIVIGIIIGPHAINLINSDNDIIELFGEVGLFYIMFLAGLEIEFVEFKKNSAKGIFFGICTFSIPFAFGYYASIYLLSLTPIPGVLVGALLASHTLIAFPITGKLGINKSSAVNTTISGTIITDTFVLIILAFITALLSEDKGEYHIWIFFILFAAFIFTMFFILPRISGWFFRTITNDGNLQYLYVLVVLFTASFLAEIVDAEPIIGAFFAGLALNKLIPSKSTLMNRIEFVGNTLFIPVFLISVGMLVNLKVIFSNIHTSIYALLLIALAISSKWIAAWLTKIIFRQTKNEMNTIFGLSSARAAATLAVALVGYEYEVLSLDIFNGTILLIMVSSLFSSYITERAGKKLSKEEKLKVTDLENDSYSRILIPIANPNSFEKLIDLAVLIHNPKSEEPIFPLTVVKDDKEAHQKVMANKPLIDKMKKYAANTGHSIQGITRVDINIPNAIIKASKELLVSEIILGWGGKTKEIRRVFGNLIESVLAGTSINVIVSHIVKPINTTEIINVYIPENAEMETGAKYWVNTIYNLSLQLSAKITFYHNSSNEEQLKKIVKNLIKDMSINYQPMSDWDNMKQQNNQNNQNQPLNIFINARPHTMSYNHLFWSLTYNLPKNIITNNTLVIYPEQYD